MDIGKKIRRHGHHMMSMATLGIVCIALWGLPMIMMAWMPDWNPQWSGWKVAGVQWKYAVTMNTEGKLLLSGAGMMWTLACAMPLFALNRLGECLYQCEALSKPVADAFRWLAHSLPGFALLNLGSFLMGTIAAETNKVPQQGFPFSTSGCHLFLITCLCLYSVAHLMRLATDAADDARSIV